MSKRTHFFAGLLLGLVVCGLVLPASVFTAFVVLLVEGCGPNEDPHNSDIHMEAVFHKERATFDRLLSMIQEDRGLERVDYNWTLPDPPNISQERLAEYRQLLKSIGCPRGFENYKSKKRILFTASVQGYMSGSIKSYCYSESSPSPLVDDLDSYRPVHKGGDEAFRKLEGNWYLIYESDF